MTKNEKLFLADLAHLIDNFEVNNNNCIVGCIVTLPSNRKDVCYQWNGEQMKEEDFTVDKIEIFSKGNGKLRKRG